MTTGSIATKLSAWTQHTTPLATVKIVGVA